MRDDDVFLNSPERNVLRMVEKYSDEDFEALLSKYDYKFKNLTIFDKYVIIYACLLYEG